MKDYKEYKMRRGEYLEERIPDLDGTVEEYQYVYDPRFWGYISSAATSVTFPNEQLPLVTPDGALPFTPGVHEFRVRSRDNSDAWEENYQIMSFYIGECE